MAFALLMYLLSRDIYGCCSLDLLLSRAVSSLIYYLLSRVVALLMFLLSRVVALLIYLLSWDSYGFCCLDFLADLAMAVALFSYLLSRDSYGCCSLHSFTYVVLLTEHA